MKYILIVIACILLCILTSCTTQITEPLNETFTVNIITDQLTQPWGMDFVNETTLIVTQKRGDILLIQIDTGNITHFANVP
ncbi:MAG: hypothetical protein ACMXYA_03660, partial [Candidatus Woesearchaeota archaeon]